MEFFKSFLETFGIILGAVLALTLLVGLALLLIQIWPLAVFLGGAMLIALVITYVRRS